MGWRENNVKGKILGREKYAEKWNKLDGKSYGGKEDVYEDNLLR